MSTERIVQLLQQLNLTEETEIDCQQTQALLPVYVELELAGEEVEAVLHQVWIHLQHCPDCRDEHLALRALEQRKPSEVDALAESLPDTSGTLSSRPAAPAGSGSA